MILSRHWGMPSADTFNCEPIKGFVQKYLMVSAISIDPFARNSRLATYRNDLNPTTSAEHHMDAEDFLKMLLDKNTVADLIIFDPPYSPRQIAECYKSFGRECSMEETQNALLYRRVRDAIVPVITIGGVVLSFGWNTVGMGKNRGFEIIEIALVCHGGAHNDTICMAERRITEMQSGLQLL